MRNECQNKKKGANKDEKAKIEKKKSEIKKKDIVYFCQKSLLTIYIFYFTVC